MVFTDQLGSPLGTAESNPPPVVDSVDPTMSPADQHIAHVLRGTMTWGYFLLLLLVLLYLAYRLWQILRPSRPRSPRRSPVHDPSDG